MRRLTAVAAAALSLGCAGETDPGALYLQDPAFRRAELSLSLVNPADGYARTRLLRYGRAWEDLPVWNPRVEAVTAKGLSAPPDSPLGAGARALDIDVAASAGDETALLRLGREAYSRYPVQLFPDQEAALLAEESAAAEYGFFTDPETGQVGGLVRAEMADGTRRFAVTCATCHTRSRDGAAIAGAPNDALDLGKLIVAAGGAASPDKEERLLAWGPGRLDVSSLDASEPARISDLRPVRFLTHLHQDATVRQRSVATLAIRIETLILRSHGDVVRPPREVALGLALDVWSFADDLPPALPADALAMRGLSIVRDACSSCHEPDGFTGPPVPIEVAGTDPTLGLSADRGTGYYRVPSLRGAGTRGPLLHDASAPDLATFFDPDRTSPGYEKGRDQRPIPGHPWNLDLPAADRAAVMAYLQGL